MLKLKTLIAATFASHLALLAPYAVHAQQDPISLKGSIERFDSAGFARQITTLSQRALDRNEDYALANDLVRKYGTRAHKTKVIAKEFVNTVVPYRGFGPSKEGSQILLEKVKKIKSLGCAEYIKQRITDETHTKTVASVLQIAMGLDCTDREKSDELVNRGMDDLVTLVGEEEAQRMLQVMTDWSRDIAVSNDIYNKESWDIAALQSKVRATTSCAFLDDEVTQEVVRKLKKHDKGKAMMVAGSVVEAGTALATLLGPGMFLPVASELANAAFVTGTGGSEPTKLVGQIYMAKRLESRHRRITEEANLALTSYERAVQSKSPTLLFCSESVMQHLVGQESAEKIIGQLVVPLGR